MYCLLTGLIKGIPTDHEPRDLRAPSSEQPPGSGQSDSRAGAFCSSS